MTHVLLVSGHLVDAPQRPVPRFPQTRVPWVRQQVRDTLEHWHIDDGTTVISGGARGADIIAAEEARSRGARVLLCLALPPDEFRQASVALPGTDWSARYDRLLDVAEVRQLPPQPNGADVFERANQWMLELAHQLDPSPYAVIVWDGKAGDGPGGTQDLVQKLGYRPDDARIRIIDPTPPDLRAP
jgi:hypothetical protein